MWFLIVVKPGASIGPFDALGGRLEVQPANYRGVHRNSLAVIAQIRFGVDRFKNRTASRLKGKELPAGLLLPDSGIGLEVFSSYAGAVEAISRLPEEDGLEGVCKEGLVRFSKEYELEIYKRRDVEIIAIRGPEVDKGYGRAPESSGSIPSIQWLGFDPWEEGEWSLIRGTINAGQSDELLRCPDYVPQVGLFRTRDSAVAFIDRYAQLARENKVEPTASTEDPRLLLTPNTDTSRSRVFPIEVGTIQ